MGGGYHTGNWSAVAEFNIDCDPEAAQIVFREPWPVTMVGLDLTHQALATPEVVARIAALGTEPARFVVRAAGVLRRGLLARAGLRRPAGARPVRRRAASSTPRCSPPAGAPWTSN